MNGIARMVGRFSEWMDEYLSEWINRWMDGVLTTTVMCVYTGPEAVWTNKKSHDIYYVTYIAFYVGDKSVVIWGISFVDLWLMVSNPLNIICLFHKGTFQKLGCIYLINNEEQRTEIWRMSRVRYKGISHPRLGCNEGRLYVRED